MTTPGAVLLDRLLPVVRQHLPAGVTPAYLDGFIARNRSTLVAALDRALSARAARPLVNEDSLPPEEWTAARRTKANLAAMRIAASTHPEAMTAEDRRVLAGYSGWGGLSIDAVKDDFPAGFPVPEIRGLIHEYYTPTRVCAEVARVVKPLLAGLAVEGQVLAYPVPQLLTDSIPASPTSSTGATIGGQEHFQANAGAPNWETFVG